MHVNSINHNCHNEVLLMRSVLRINLIFVDITNTCADIVMLFFRFVIVHIILVEKSVICKYHSTCLCSSNWLS